jgi:hypothetical protein
MKAKRIGKTFLSSLIFLISVLTLWQSGWACDEPTGECYEQLDIKWVDVDYDNKLIYIWGEHFDNGPINPPVVTLAGIPLRVDSSNWEWIVAQLPSVPDQIPYGQYRLRVSTGSGPKCKDKYSVKIHPAPPKPSCEPSPPQCTCSPETCTYICPQPTCTCPEVTFVTEIVSTVEFSEETIIVSDNEVKTGNFKGTAKCPDGYRVTGGGFSLGKSFGIIESKPSADGTAWELVVEPKPDITYAPSDVKVWAVCGKVQKVQQSP